MPRRDESVVIPVTHEEAGVSKKEVETGAVRVRKPVREHASGCSRKRSA
jgi:stress response protein YsnF